MSTKEQKAQQHANGNGERRFLSANDILTIEDRPIKEFYAPEWDGWLYIRGLTGEQRRALEELTTTTDDEGNSKTDLVKFLIGLCAIGIVNADGERQFIGEEARALLAQRGIAGLTRVGTEISRISGLQKSDREQVKGNSEGSTGTVAQPV